MKLHEEFQVDQPAEAIWAFFEQPELVSACMPGVEQVTVLDEDNVSVRATQSIGPMSATFDARVTVTERVPNERISFTAVGKSVKGAAGNVRSTNAVRLVPSDSGTTVVVDLELALAGALGSVGQKIVAKQAGRVTAEFARNLERSLRGEPPAIRPTAAPPAGTAPSAAATAAVTEPARPDPWVRAAAVLSAVSAVLSIVSVLRSLRRGIR